ncbi:hypothetical protein EYF80_009100 [Liparis tanakae]|uniref:Uncharacterized protein n=1 Tax=Liparis tanakae TaxID=230148 RepID=A0A4Z2ISV3_9TELE|nr:hypothetical protein EYF80_009100 [Liparis tanakae]
MYITVLATSEAVVLVSEALVSERGLICTCQAADPPAPSPPPPPPSPPPPRAFTVEKLVPFQNWVKNYRSPLPVPRGGLPFLLTQTVIHPFIPPSIPPSNQPTSLWTNQLTTQPAG